jgi:hypothetical protein
MRLEDEITMTLGDDSTIQSLSFCGPRQKDTVPMEFVPKGVKRKTKQQKIHETRGKFEFAMRDEKIPADAQALLREIAEKPGYVTQAIQNLGLPDLMKVQEDLSANPRRVDSIMKSLLERMVPEYRTLMAKKEQIDSTMTAIECAWASAFTEEYFEGSNYDFDSLSSFVDDEIDEREKKEKEAKEVGMRAQLEHELQRRLEGERERMRAELLAQLAQQRQDGTNMQVDA